MRVMVTIDHPWQQSFNHAILGRVVTTLQEAGHEIDVLDLHRENFDPVMRAGELAVYTQGQHLDPKVSSYQRRIEQAEHLIYIFPVWWEVMPALLKGFFDKVFLPEWAFREADAAPLLTFIKTGTVITTMGAPKPVYTSVEPVLCKGILEFCGVLRTRWFNICEVGVKTQEERRMWLSEIETYLRALS
jgi:NAD(P)H dehydrogenase (quinone)